MRTQTPRSRILRRPSRQFQPRRPTEPQRTGLRHWESWVDGAIVLLSLVALGNCVRFHSSYATWPFIPLSPLLLTSVSRDYRRHVLERLRRLGASLTDFQATRRRLPWAATLVFVVIPVALLNLSNRKNLGVGDSFPVAPTAVSWVLDRDSALDELVMGRPWRRSVSLPPPLPYYLQRRGSHVYSSYPAGMVPFAVPPAVLARVFQARLHKLNVLLRMEKLTASVVAALAMGLFFLLALQVAPVRAALVTTWLLAASSGMWTTCGQGLWQQGGVIFWSTVVLLVEFRASEHPSRIGTFFQGVACGMLPACRLTTAVFLVPFGLWILARSPRRAVAIVSVALVTFLPWAWFYQTTYGHLFGPSSGFLALSCWRTEILESLAGVLFSPGRGLLVYQPWIVLAALVGLPLVRRLAAASGVGSGPLGWRLFCVVVIALQVVMISAWGMWWGGHCWGSRLILEVVPLCALFCLGPVAVLLRFRWGRALIASLALVGVLVQVPYVYLDGFDWNRTADVDHHPERLWSWSRAPFLFPLTGQAPSRSEPGLTQVIWNRPEDSRLIGWARATEPLVPSEDQWAMPTLRKSTVPGDSEKPFPSRSEPTVRSSQWHGPEESP